MEAIIQIVVQLFSFTFKELSRNFWLKMSRDFVTVLVRFISTATIPFLNLSFLLLDLIPLLEQRQTLA